MDPKKVAFIDRNGRTELECKLTSLPLKENKIIEKSMELFNDPEPCIIHKSFAMKKLLLEICEYFSAVLPEGKGQIMCGDIPPNIRELLCIGDNVTTLQLDL
ncbi:MAG TPA: hypothetical protein VF941_22105 [Clostridia bacterium]